MFFNHEKAFPSLSMHQLIFCMVIQIELTTSETRYQFKSNLDGLQVFMI